MLNPCKTITNFLTRPFTQPFCLMELNRKINLGIEIYKTHDIIKDKQIER